MTDNAIAWLMNWYADQCDGEWEHHAGIVIGTSDNPGWIVRVDLAATTLEDLPFEPQSQGDQSERRWLMCSVVEKTFVGSGGPQDLVAVINVFRAWASQA